MTFALPTNIIGTGYYLDHAQGAIHPWAKRVPLLYAAWMGKQLATDVFETKDKPTAERNRVLRNDVLQLGIPMLATYVATQWQMPPDAEAYNTTQAGLTYIQQHYAPPSKPSTPTPEVAFLKQAQADSQARTKQLAPVKAILWGKQPTETLTTTPITQVLQQQETTPLLDVQVGNLIKEHRLALEAQLKTPQGHWKPDAPQHIYNRLHRLEATAWQSLLERAKAAQGEDALPTEAVKNTATLKAWMANEANTDHAQAILKQVDWPHRLEEERHALFNEHGQLKAGKSIQNALNTLFRNELRLLLPTNEELSEPLTVVSKNGVHIENLWPVLKNTISDFANEAAKPFLIVGGLSVGAGILAGVLTNRLDEADQRNKLTQHPTNLATPLALKKIEKDRVQKDENVFKEGIFQYVANIAMCGFGAGTGLLTANLLGFTKYSNPQGRFASVSAGLAAGIMVGSKLANPISKQVERFFDDDATLEAHKKPKLGRKLEGSDIILHVDDIPTAFSVAGVQALKPWIPPFFVQSGIRTAKGYRNSDDATSPIAPTSLPFQLHRVANDPTPAKPVTQAPWG